MKYLLEYDSSELDSLLGDLGALGMETLQGWVIIWYGEYDLPRTEIIIASSGKEALSIYLQKGYFAPDFQKLIKTKYKDATKVDFTKFIKETEQIKADFSLWFNMLVQAGKVRKFTAVKDLMTQNNITSPSYSVLEENPDPYHQVHILETLFTNSKKKFEEAKTLTRKEGDLKTTLIDPNDYYPENRKSSNGWMA